MKLKTITKLAKETQQITLFDATDRMGTITQWAHIQGALYPVNGSTPYMDEIALCELMDVPDKKLDDWIINVGRAIPAAAPIQDVDPDEAPAEALSLTIGSGGTILRPIRCRGEVLLIEAKLLTALEQEHRGLEVYVRQMGQDRIIAVKTGILLQGLILPVQPKAAGVLREQLLGVAACLEGQMEKEAREAGGQ